MSHFNTARKYGARVLAVAGGTLAGGAAMAQTNPIVTVLDSVTLDGIAAAVAAAALVVVAIALTFKGPDVAKRIIRKV